MSKTTKIIISIVVIALLVCCAWLVWAYFSPYGPYSPVGKDLPIDTTVAKKNETVSENVQNDTTLTNQTVTADWKTYRNLTIGFEIKYPKHWKFEEIPIYDKDGKILASENQFFFTNPKVNQTVVVSSIGENRDFPEKDLLETKEMRFGDMMARWRKFGDSGGIYNISIDQFSKIPTHPNFMISTTPVTANTYLDSRKISEFYTLLSTFKFTKN